MSGMADDVSVGEPQHRPLPDTVKVVQQEDRICVQDQRYRTQDGMFIWMLMGYAMACGQVTNNAHANPCYNVVFGVFIAVCMLKVNRQCIVT